MTNQISPIQVRSFANGICDAMSIYAYMAVACVHFNNATFAHGGWVGTVPLGTKSRAPHVAYSKLGELVLLGGGSNGQLIMTPVEGNELSLGWMGAVAQNGTAIAVSKLAQEHDKLLALITLYHAIHNDLSLHHVGFRFEDFAAYTRENRLFRGGMVRNVPGDHDRTYFPLSGGRYREHQWFPGGPHDRGKHWDFVTEQPEDFLWFVARAFGKEPVIFEDSGANDPMGVVWVTAESDGSKLGVMARRTHWVVENG